MIPISTPVRVALLVAGALAQVALLRPDNAHAAVGLTVGLLVLVGATIFNPKPPAAQGPVSAGSGIGLRTWIAATILVVSVAYTLLHIAPRDTGALGRSLALILVATQIAQTLVMRTQRDAALSGVLIGVMLVAAGMFASGPAVGWALVPSAAALVAAFALLQADPPPAADAIRVGNRPSALRSAVPVTVAVWAIGSVVLLLVSAATPLGTEAKFRQASGRGGTGSTTRVGGSAALGALNLNDRSALTTSPVLSVPLTDATEYLQGTIYDHFDGTTWQITDAARSSKTWARSGEVQQNQEASGSEIADGARLTVTVLQNNPIGVAFSPGRTVEYAGDGRVSTDGNGAPRFAGTGPRRGETYTVVSSNPAARPLAPPSSISGPEPSDTRWLQLPAVPNRVTELARQLTANAPSRAAKVAVLEAYLQTTETYDLNSPVPPDGEDPVENFLFVSHRGFCEQFATADIVMLRSLGIPARLVTGYAFGDTDEKSGTRTMRSKDLHAWVQVRYPGTGWVSNDPTGSAAASEAAPHSATSLLSHVVSAAKSIPGGTTTRVSALAGLLLVVAGVILRRRRRLGRARSTEIGSGDGPALSAFRELDERLWREDLGRADGESLREFADRLGAIIDVRPADLPQPIAVSSTELAGAIRIVEAECYRSGPAPDTADVTRAVEILKRLDTRLLGDVTRHLARA